MNLVRAVVAILLLTLAAAADAEPAAPPAADAIYRLAPDDRIKVTVYGEDDLTGEYLVGSDGTVSFPLIGTVPASGKSVADFRALLTERLRGMLKEPRVSADLVGYRPFYILGEVNKAGQYPFRVGMTVNAAVATAGGFTYRANHKTVAIQHAGEAGEQRYRITPDLRVLAGDTIRVLERFF